MLAPGHYQILLSELWQAGFTVAGLHFSGHGHLVARNDFTFRTLLGEALKAEAWLCANGYGPVAVCGHSQGGILALAHAGISNSLVAAFSLSAVFPAMKEAIALTRFAPLARRRDQIMKLLRLLAGILPQAPVPLPFYLELGRITAGKRKPVHMGRAKGRICYPLKYLVSLFDADFSRKLNCPWWLYSSKNDALFTPELIEAAFKAVRAPEKTLCWLEDGGHMAPINQELACFIARNIASECAGLGMHLTL